MRINCLQAALVAVGVLGIAGCGEVTPEQIEEWKNQGTATKLLSALADNRQFIRIDAIAALGELKDPAAIAELGTLINDPDPVIVHKAIEALAEIGGPGIEPYMLKAIGFKTEPARQMAATALGSIKSASAVDLLIAALDDNYESVVEAAALALGQIGDSKAAMPLTKKLSANSFKVRDAALTSLRQIGGQDTAAGLASVMGDFSEDIRTPAVQGLIEAGDVAVPFALAGLRSENEFTRSSSTAILKGTGNTPESGSDLTWFMLADIPTDPKAEIDAGIVSRLSEVENGIDALIEALIHPDVKIHQYACRALLTIGEPATASTVAAVDQHASKAARKWFADRSNWPGAPSWRIDLWAAVTALNPLFKFNPSTAKTLSEQNEAARALMRSSQFVLTPEYTPLVIVQCAETVEENKASQKNTDMNRELAEKNLSTLGGVNIYPLIAALDDADLSIVSSCARALLQIDRETAQPLIIEAFANRVEAGTDLSGSDFLKTVVLLNDADAEALVAKIRPNEERAVQVFERSFPDSRVSINPLPPGEQHPTAEPFRMKYLKDGKSNEFKVIFRPNADGDWVPNPPLPDQLP